MLDFVRSDKWIEAERELAAALGIELLEADGRLLSLVEEEVNQSDFAQQDILDVFAAEYEQLVAFSLGWQRLNEKNDYGEEWNPAEGNQQVNSPEPVFVGISQGFLVGSTLFYLYAQRRPDLLLSYLRRRRIPDAKKVAEDIIDVYSGSTR